MLPTERVKVKSVHTVVRHTPIEKTDPLAGLENIGINNIGSPCKQHRFKKAGGVYLVTSENDRLCKVQDYLRSKYTGIRKSPVDTDKVCTNSSCIR